MRTSPGSTPSRSSSCACWSASLAGRTFRDEWSMSTLPSSVPGVLGNTSLSQFDVIIIGSGAGGSMAARTLTQVGGQKVLILEAGPNYFMGLDDPAPNRPIPLFSNDELKLNERRFIRQDPFLEP